MKQRLALVILFCILHSALSILHSSAQPVFVEKVEQGSNSLTIGYEKWRLPNGLTILIHEDHSDPIVNVQVTYRVGSNRESIGKSGFAHFFEHMMFEGSEHIGDGEHFKIISAAGGTLNGYTQRDKTVYYETMPANCLELALWMEADRMGFLLDSVTKEKFEVQRATVKNEKGQRIENVPYGLVGEVYGQTLYPGGHPYSWPTIGYVDDLDRVTVDDLKNFFLRWYGPNNAILTVAGDVNPKDVVALADKYFGTLVPCPEVKKMRTSAVVLPSDKYASYSDNIYLPLTLMVYPTVPQYHRDEPALNLMGSMMGEGKSSVFYKNFIKSEKALQAGTGHGGSELAGEFQVFVLAYPSMGFFDVAKDFNETEKLIRSTIDEFEKDGITDEALQRVKAKTQSDIVEQVTSVFGKASLLTEWQLLVPRQFNLQDELARYEQVTKEDISRVYNKYIKGKYAAIVNVYPKDPESKDSVKSINPNAGLKATDDAEYAGLKYVKAKDSFDRSKRPAEGTPKVPAVPAFYTKEYKNGIKLIGMQASEAPKVVIQLTLSGGDLVFPYDQRKMGLAQLTADLMDEGTEKYTTEEISAELDKLGSSISFSAGTENTTILVNSLTKNIDATLKLLEEKLFRPRFAPEDFKRVRKQTIEALQNERKNADATAEKLFRNLIYGNTIFGAYVTDKGIKKYTLDDVKQYYKDYYTPVGATVVVVGDIAEKDILPKLEFLNKWEGKPVKLPEPVTPAYPQQTQIYLCDKPGAAQSVIVAGHPGMVFDATGDYYRASILNYPLGGAFNSRLNLNLREDKGYTYGIRSSFSGTKYPGTFSVSAGVKRSATDSCITEIMKELNGYKANGITDEELSFTKSSLLNSEALRYETPFQKAGFLSRIIRYNLPKDFTAQQSKILKDISKSEVNSYINKYISPDKLVILVVGNKVVIKDKLDKLGYGKTKDITLD